MSLSYTETVQMLEPPTGRIRVVLDTDTYNEIDDQFALVQMVLSPERFNIEAFYAAPFHNRRSNGPKQGMERSYDEILRLLERLGISDYDNVKKGVVEYVGPEKVAREAPAVDDLIARAKAGSKDDPLYVVAIGAISNVASALLKAPEIADRIVVVWLGGHALEWPETREFNLRQDIGGAQVLIDSGVPLVLVPCMGVTSHLLASVPEIERYVEPHGEIGKFLSTTYKGYTDEHKGWSKEIWDMAPVAWLLDPEWTPSSIVAAPILTDEGFWAIDRSRHPIRYVHQVHRDPIMKDFYAKLEKFAAS